MAFQNLGRKSQIQIQSIRMNFRGAFSTQLLSALSGLQTLYVTAMFQEKGLNLNYRGEASADFLS